MFVLGGDDCGIVLRHSLAFADELRRRVLVNRESAKGVAADLGLDPEQAQGAARLLRSLHYSPSPERLALVVMRDPGLDNADIAEIFGRSKRWAVWVRGNADELRAVEPIPMSLEYLDDGLQASDPTPAEILESAEKLRESGRLREKRPRLRSDYASIPFGA